MANKNLTTAKRVKNDEFYTKAWDITQEASHYREQFEGKTIYCNCDDYRFSQFYQTLIVMQSTYKWKKLITTHFSEDGVAYKTVTLGEDLECKPYTDEEMISGEHSTVTRLEGNGDFRSEECVEILKEADIVFTNPPFSLFRDFIALMEEHGKQFLVIGSQNAITYKDCFKLIKDNKMWLGVNTCKEFIQPDGTIKKFGNIGWFTNMNHHRRNLKMDLFQKYDPEMFPKYDNYDAIEVSKTCDIPEHYDGVMGVPITFLTKYNPEQFEILGQANSARWLGDIECLTIINGRKIYNRLLIKHKKGA
jgi:hypothetical protein